MSRHSLIKQHWNGCAQCTICQHGLRRAEDSRLWLSFGWNCHAATILWAGDLDCMADRENSEKINLEEKDSTAEMWCMDMQICIHMHGCVQILQLVEAGRGLAAQPSDFRLKIGKASHPRIWVSVPHPPTSCEGFFVVEYNRNRVISGYLWRREKLWEHKSAIFGIQILPSLTSLFGWKRKKQKAYPVVSDNTLVVPLPFWSWTHFI